MIRGPRSVVVCSLIIALALSAVPLGAQTQKLRFGVGPLQPTPAETKKAFEPFFADLAKKLNREYDLVATTDWAGISVALANEQVDLACGVLLLALRGRMESMRPGQVLRLVAQDAGAPEDLPAWCRLTGHTLLSAEPPVYLIRRKRG